MEKGKEKQNGAYWNGDQEDVGGWDALAYREDEMDDLYLYAWI